MTIQEWGRDAVNHIRQDGWTTGGKQAVREFYRGAFRQFGKRWNYGRYIYEYDWDFLIILDACRADLMYEVADEYQFTSTQSAFSCASSSGEWHRKNFTDKYAAEKARTALVSANPYTDMHVESEDFQLLDEVWRDAFDSNLGTVLPERVVDRTISAYRKSSPERLIAHFMQPHYPFIPDPLDEGIAIDYDHTPWDTVWDRLRKGEVSKQQVWEAYADNLRYVLDQVDTLLRNIEAERVVITADHGNLLGEFGLYAHPQYVPIPALKRVPWIVTSAQETGEYESDEYESTDIAVEDQLEALGYK
jgi:hypothetical protein